MIGAAYQSLSPSVRVALAGGLGRIAGMLVGSVWKRLWDWVLGSRDAKAVRHALQNAVAGALVSRPELEAITFATVLQREPFRGLIVRVLQNPHEEVDAGEVHRAFGDSIYDLTTIGIDELALVEEIRSRFITALRTGTTPESKQLFTVTRIEQIRQSQSRLEGGQDRITAGLETLLARSETPAESGGDKDPDEAWQLRVEEARALHKAGAVRSALRLWERLRDDLSSGAATPALRSRVHHNIGAALTDLARPAEAIEAFTTALDYTPNNVDLLALLAQAKFLAGLREEASLDAERATALDPLSTPAWSVRIQASTILDENAIPLTLRDHPQVLMARALRQAATDTVKGAELLRAALRIGPRDPQLLILLGEMIYSTLFPRLINDMVPENVITEIARLGHEASTALKGTERSRLIARALVLEGLASELQGKKKEAVALFSQAVEVDPAHERARFGAASLQLSLGNTAAALYLLDGLADGNRSSSWHALRAAALSMCGRSTEIDKDVLAAMAKTEHETPDIAVGHSLSETVLRAKRYDLVNPVQEFLESTGQHAYGHLLAARVADARGDKAAGRQEYRSAVEAFPPSLRAEIEGEFASYLYRNGDLEAAAQLFEASDSWTRLPGAARQYAACLYKQGRWDRASVLLGRLRSQGELADWAVDLEARVARYRNDPRGELVALERLIELHPEDPEIRTRMAYVLVRLEEERRALEILAPLKDRQDLEYHDGLNVAQLLSHLGQATPALQHAYRVLRQCPDDPDVQVACVVNVFYHATESGPPDSALFERTEVTEDTWVKLRAEDGEEIEYLILSQEPHDVRRNEFLSTDSRALMLLGLKMGDAVRLRPGAANEKEFHVVELKSALLYAFHDAMLQYQNRFPGRLDMQMVHMGGGESFDPWPVYRMILQTQEVGRLRLDLYAQQRLPIGALATIQGLPLRRTYLQLLNDPKVRVFVEDPADDALAQSLAAARSTAIVLTASGLATLRRIEMLPLLAKLYDHLLVPQSLIDEFNQESDHWDEAGAHGGYHTAGVTDEHTFTFGEVSPASIAAVREDLAQLREFVLKTAEVLPRPLAAEDPAQEEVRRLIGASSYDSYKLAGDSIGLYADDLGLRLLARAEAGVDGFSTYALLRLAEERGLLTSGEVRRLVSRLIMLGHVFIPIDVALLYQTFVEQSYQINDVVLSLIGVLADPTVTIESAVHVAVGFIRQLALSPLGHGSVGAITSVLLDRLSTGRNPSEVVRLFTTVSRQAFSLLPIDLALVQERIAAFVMAKKLS